MKDEIPKSTINKFEKKLFKIDGYKVSQDESIFLFTDKKNQVQLQFLARNIHRNISKAISKNPELIPEDFTFSIKEEVLLVLNESDNRELTSVNPIGLISFTEKPLFPFHRL